MAELDEGEEQLPEWPSLWIADENDKVELVESVEHVAVQQELADARGELQKANEAVLTMRNKIAELKTYKVEPKCVEVIHAAFVLLGTDPKEVADWNEVRRMLTPEFFNGLTSFSDASAPSKRTEKQVEKLMSALDPEAVKNSSEALLSLYNWVLAGRKLLHEAAQLPFKLRDLAGKVPEELTGDLYADYESTCNTLELAPHPQLLPKVHSARARAEAVDTEAPKDPKAKGGKGGDVVKEEDPHACNGLKVSGKRLDQGSMFALAKCLPVCTSCVEIDFWSADISTACFARLAAVLPSTSVQKLSLDWSLGNLESKEKNLSLLVCEGTKLSSLSLRSNGLDEAIVSALSEHLCDNTTLQVLDLSNNFLGDGGAAPLLTVLEQPTSALTCLSLNECELTDSFAAGLVTPLGMRPYSEEELAQVEEIKLKVDEINARNAALKKGEPEPVPSVPKVITNEEGVALGGANRILKQLLLGANKISMVGVQQVASILENNDAIELVYLKLNSVSHEDELLVNEPRIFLSEMKATRDQEQQLGHPLLQDLLEQAAQAPPPPEDQDEATTLAEAVESSKVCVQDKMGVDGVQRLAAVALPGPCMKAIVQAALSIVGEPCESTEDWEQCVRVLGQVSELEPQEEGSEPEKESPVFKKLLDVEAITGAFMDPQASLCARYYLDCAKWCEGQTLRGGSLHAHVLEQYLLAVQALADKQMLLAEEASNVEGAEEGAVQAS